MHYYNKLKTKKSICTGNKQKIYIHQASQQTRIKQEMKEVDCHEKKIKKICPKCHMLLYVEICPVWVACKSH